MVPKTQRALVVRDFNIGPVLETDFPVPEPQNGEVLVNIKYSGVCHSDVTFVRDELVIPIKLPLIAGHEAVGVVAKLGTNVSGFQVGDAVGVMMIKSSCKCCEHCKSGQDNLCNQLEYMAVANPGTFQEYTVVDAHHLYRLPEGIDMPGAAPLFCAGLTVYRALKETSVKPGEFVTITGAGGGLGSFAIQFARAMGMIPIAVDIDKEQHCKQVGAEYYFEATDAEMSKKILKATKLGSHGVLNTAGNAKAVECAFAYLRKSGTIVNVGIPKNSKFEGDVVLFILKSATLKGSSLGNRKDMDEAIAFYARGAVKVPVKIMGLSEVPEILKLLHNCQVNGRIVVNPLK